MEEVLVVERALLDSLLPEKEFVGEDVPEILARILADYRFAPRPAAEQDSSLKQLIPYVVIRQKGQYFLLRRLKQQTESRLHDKLSLGVGGHINPGEVLEGHTILEAGLFRELEEEVDVEKILRLDCLGLINENTDGVSNFHLGVAYLLEADGEVAVRETDKMEGRWVTVDELRQLMSQLETWSRIVLGRLELL